MVKTFLRAFLKPLSFIPAIVMMYVIFSFSSQDGTASGNLSYQVSEFIVETVNEALELGWTDGEEEYYIQKIHYPVRKLAHMAEYFLLAVSVSFPLYVYGVRGIWLPLLAGRSVWASRVSTNTISPLWRAEAHRRRMWPLTA